MSDLAASGLGPDLAAGTPPEVSRAGEAALVVQELSVRYSTASGEVAAVNGVDLRVRRGELLAVIGESGSGKSTLARGMLRLLPRAGRVVSGRVGLPGGIDLLSLSSASLREVRGRVVGFVPQATGGALNPVRRVRREFEVTLRAHGTAWRGGGRERAEQALLAAGIADPAFVLHAYPHELSGGMAQRAVVALATVLQPALLVADEPTSALDVTVQRLLLDNLAADVRSHERGAIVITHDIGIARRYSQQVLVMYGGYAVESGPSASVLGEPRHPYTEALLEAVASRRGGRRPPPPGAPEERGSGGTARRRADARVAAAATGGQPGACPYFARCQRRDDPRRADERCARELPAMREVAPGHLVRSFCG